MEREGPREDHSGFPPKCQRRCRRQAMSERAPSLDAQKKGWSGLRRLHPSPIDLQRVALIREMDQQQLSRPENIEALLLQLGLNDEAMHEIPESLHPYCGQGLRIWQYPNQYSRY